MSAALKPMHFGVLLAATLMLPSVALGQFMDMEPPPRVVPPAETLERLRAGEITVEVTQRELKGGAARVQAVFLASPELIWRVLEDCTANQRIMPGLEECELLERETRYARTRQRIDPGWFLPAIEFEFQTVREPYRWIRIALERGDLEALEGTWRFDPLEEGEGEGMAPGELLVTHEIRLQPRFTAPRWLVRRTLVRDLPDMLACLRAQAQASPPPVAEDDRERCSGPDPVPPR